MIKRTLITMLFILGFTMPVTASEIPGYYHPDYSIQGTLARVSAREGIIVVNDRSLTLSQNLRVYTPSTQFGTVQLLRAGMRIGTDLDQSNTIREIWILPQDFKPNPQTVHRP